MNRMSAIAATALVLCAFTGSASAADPQTKRAVTALGMAIAAQGDAALVQIRRELRESALAAMKPFLTEVVKAPEPQQLAATPAAQR
jgi:hypothetical protein